MTNTTRFNYLRCASRKFKALYFVNIIRWLVLILARVISKVTSLDIDEGSSNKTPQRTEPQEQAA